MRACGADGRVSPYIFTQKKVNGMGEARLKRFDAGAGVSSFTVTGLVPGVEYCVYGVFTDAPFVEATVVSESLRNRTAGG